MNESQSSPMICWSVQWMIWFKLQFYVFRSKIPMFKRINDRASVRASDPFQSANLNLHTHRFDPWNEWWFGHRDEPSSHSNRRIMIHAYIESTLGINDWSGIGKSLRHIPIRESWSMYISNRPSEWMMIRASVRAFITFQSENHDPCIYRIGPRNKRLIWHR